MSLKLQDARLKARGPWGRVERGPSDPQVLMLEGG
jgi:hypothetical protein